MNLKTISTSFLFSLLLCPQVSAQGRYVDLKYRIGGYERTAVLFLPSGIAEGAPIVTCVHGYGGKANPKDFDLDAVAEREKFAVLYPQGLRDPKGNTGFNVGYPMQEGMQVDDVEMLCQLTRRVERDYKLSRKDAFLTGMSNGGDICYLAAMQGQTTFRAMAPIAGLSFTWSQKKYTHRRHRPLPLMEVHGTQDHVSEWFGDPDNKGGWGPYLPVPVAVGYWVAANGCVRVDVDTIRSKRGNDGHLTICHRYSGGPEGCDVWLYEVVGAPHCWHNADINTGEEIWRFFKRYLSADDTAKAGR